MTDPVAPSERPRAFAGYAGKPPRFRWPGNRGLAVNFVLNVEEGSEYSIGNGDGRSESALIEVRATRVPKGDRDLAAESMYEYGSRAGFWRIYNTFRDRGLPLTIFAAAQALEAVPEVAAAIAATDWDICAHGNRWIEHYLIDPTTEAEHIAAAHASIMRTTGRAPAGWYCRYSASMATRGLVAAHGGYLYDSDSYSDDLPYWTEVAGKPHLVVPYTMVNNDAKFMSGDIFAARDFAEFLIDAIEVLRAEAKDTPRMISIGLHARVIGHPGRFAALKRVFDHLADCPDCWICSREALARHFIAQGPAPEGMA